MTVTTWDIETTTKTSFKRKANPFDKDNWVVTHAFSRAKEKPVEYRFGSTHPQPGWLRPVLDGCTLLVGQNIKFDLLHALQDPDNLEAWMDFVVRGGQIWDIQLAEYLLRGMVQQSHMLSLDELAPEYGGNVKFDEVKALWEAGYNTHEIEPALLTRYLIGEGDEHGDIGNTRLVAYGQIAKARERGQLRSIMLNMGSLICSVELERNGMYVDKALGLEHATELAAELATLKAGLQQYLPTDLPFEFKWTNRYHLSPLIFGGQVKYECRSYELKDGSRTWTPPDPQGLYTNYAYVQKDVEHFILEDGTTMECLWYEHLCGTEWADSERPEGKYIALFASGKRAGERKTKKFKADDYTKPKSAMRDRFYEFPGVTKPQPSWASATPGLYSVASDVIEELGVRGIPFLTDLAKVMSVTKDLGTYYITYDEDGVPSGMLALVDEHGIIHHRINHTSTVTGRFSSSDPNLQNVPKGSTSRIKLVFISRFGGYIIQSDFSSLEVYIQAILTDCKQLITDLLAGVDMHVKRLALKEGMDYQAVYNLAKGYMNSHGVFVDAEPEWDTKRTKAKVFSFQRAYGAGAAKVAASTGMLLSDVEALIEAEELEYPEIGIHFSRRADQIKQNRRPTGVVHAHPEFPNITCHIGESFISTPDGKVYGYRENPAPGYLVKRGVACSFSPTQIKNYEVQGLGGEWAKAAMWLAVREFYRVRNFGGLALLVNQVHDALYADSHKDVAFEAAALLHACMEGASDLMAYYFNWPIQLPVPSDTTWGASMMDEAKIPGLAARAAVLRSELQARYMPGYVPSFQKKATP